MTLSEAMATGGVVTLTGLLIVFSVLIILMLVMMLMKKIFYKENTPAKTEMPVPAPAAAPAPAPVQAQANDAELVAILTAAIAASLNTSTYNLKIKSYRRIGNTAPAWNKAGRRDVIDSRF